MNNKKQKLIVEYLMSSTDTFAICQGIVQPEYFDPELRGAVKFIKDYYEHFSTTPNADQVEAETGVELQQRQLTPDQINYTTTEIETFCRQRAIEKAVLSAPKLIDAGDYGTLETKIREAVLISLHRNLGLRYFENPEQRLQEMLKESPVIPTGWNAVDELLFGGISRKELLLVSANSGGGKSITLSNLGFNFLQQKMNVLYVSLELSDKVIGQRFDTMFTGISRKDWKSHVNEITTRLIIERDNVGILDIIQMPSGTTARDIRAYLKEYYLHYNIVPDLLILDYIDKMSPNERIDASDVWTKDKLCAEQLRDIGVDYNMVIATASQLNRDAVKASHHDHSHIAGGISKINESDVYWSIVMTDSMKAAGQIAFTLQKTRNSDGVGNTIYLKWDNKRLRILDQDNNSHSSLTLKKSQTKLIDDTEEVSTKGGLIELMSSLNSS
jgi:sulfur relay (sulfurtransferase) DsrC/TusE family protein